MSEELLLEIKKGIDDLNEKLMMTKQEVFDAKEAAIYLRIGYDTILRLARMGDIDYIKNGDRYIFKKEHLDRWLDKQERRSRK